MIRFDVPRCDDCGAPYLPTSGTPGLCLSCARQQHEEEEPDDGTPNDPAWRQSTPPVPSDDPDEPAL